MNEELQQALADMINQSVAVAGDALAFTQEQQPEVVQQLLVWKLAAAGVAFVIGAILVVAALCAIGKVIKARAGLAAGQRNWAWNAWKDGGVWIEGAGLTVIMASTPVLIAGLIIAGISLFTAIQIWLAPKVYLIEYAANLVK